MVKRKLVSLLFCHTTYVIFIAFPLQQWLQERGLMVRYTYTACRAIMYASTRNTDNSPRLTATRKHNPAYLDRNVNP